MGAPLEDARHLCQRYDRLRQEAETQVIIVIITYLAAVSFCIVINVFFAKKKIEEQREII